MRFQVEPCVQEGDMRIITRFLFFPKCIGEEVRWLEKARIKQVARYNMCGNAHWFDHKWEND